MPRAPAARYVARAAHCIACCRTILTLNEERKKRRMNRHLCPLAVQSECRPRPRAPHAFLRHGIERSESRRRCRRRRHAAYRNGAWVGGWCWICRAWHWHCASCFVYSAPGRAQVVRNRSSGCSRNGAGAPHVRESAVLSTVAAHAVNPA